jgi:hypothetical protein
MDSDASHGVQASKVALGDSIRSSVASFLSYLELRLKLLQGNEVEGANR